MLVVDADERFDSQLQKSVAVVLQRAVNPERPFVFLRRNLYMGKLVRLYARQDFGYSNDWAVERHHQGQTTWFITPFLKGIFSFLRESLLRGAILSGPYGFILAMIEAYYFFAKYMRLYIMNHQKKSSDFLSWVIHRITVR